MDKWKPYHCPQFEVALPHEVRLDDVVAVPRAQAVPVRPAPLRGPTVQPRPHPRQARALAVAPQVEIESII